MNVNYLVDDDELNKMKISQDEIYQCYNKYLSFQDLDEFKKRKRLFDMDSDEVIFFYGKENDYWTDYDHKIVKYRIKNHTEEELEIFLTLFKEELGSDMVLVEIYKYVIDNFYDYLKNN